MPFQLAWSPQSTADGLHHCAGQQAGNLGNATLNYDAGIIWSLQSICRFRLGQKCHTEASYLALA